MQDLLENFYQNREVNQEIKLKLVEQGVFGAFRLQSAEFDGVNDASKAYLETRREEMNDFTNFFKNRFFAE